MKLTKLNKRSKKTTVNVSTELNIFLDVPTESPYNYKFTTSPYKKLTSDNSIPLNYHSECPQKYKIAIIKNLIHRAIYIFSSKTRFYRELTNIKQTFVYNNSPNKLVYQ